MLYSLTQFTMIGCRPRAGATRPRPLAVILHSSFCPERFSIRFALRVFRVPTCCVLAKSGETDAPLFSTEETVRARAEASVPVTRHHSVYIHCPSAFLFACGDDKCTAEERVRLR